MPPDREFVLGALPQHPEILIFVGADHGFKFASLVGKILSELALHGKTEKDEPPKGLASCVRCL